MNYHVYRKTRLVDGKLVKDRVYRGRYRLEDQTKRTDIALNTSDKRVAEQRLEQIVREKQMEASGIIPPEAIRKAAKSPLQEHLAQYVADLTALKRDDQYIYELKNRVNRLIRECGWNQLKDITPDSFQIWRAKQTLSGKTLNEYLTSVCSLLNWMEKQERINRNPLRHVEKVPTNGVKVRPRRAYSGTELEKLLEVAGDNRVVYLTAVYTGLRRGELAALEPEDVHLDAAKPFLNVRASTTKSRKQATIALHPDVVAELSEHMAKLPTSAERVFDGYMPTMEQLKAHLALAGIDFLDRKGRRVDFHSLRHTLNTKLAIAGVAPRVAMEIMRHSCAFPHWDRRN
jgi:integrase